MPNILQNAVSFAILTVTPDLDPGMVEDVLGRNPAVLVQSEHGVDQLFG